MDDDGGSGNEGTEMSAPPSLPGTPAGWLPGAKRAGSSIGRGATSVYQNGALAVQNITGLGLAVYRNNGK